MSEEKVINSITINTETATKILQRVIVKENNNIKTKEKNDGEMVRLIQKLIQEEVECY